MAVQTLLLIYFLSNRAPAIPGFRRLACLVYRSASATLSHANIAIKLVSGCAILGRTVALALRTPCNEQCSGSSAARHHSLKRLPMPLRV
jgi:hypothetical protein